MEWRIDPIQFELHKGRGEERTREFQVPASQPPSPRQEALLLLSRIVFYFYFLEDLLDRFFFQANRSGIVS